MHLLREKDPASGRLSDATVIAIHNAHRAGEPWASIAARSGCSRKTVARIINGDRWERLHPVNAPHLYGGDDHPRDETYTLSEIQAAARVGYQEFVQALRTAHLKQSA